MRIVMSGEYPELVRALEARGYEVIPTQRVMCFHQPEQLHADMQILTLPERDVFLLRGNDEFNMHIENILGGSRRIIYTEKPITEFRYPECVKLNAAIVGHHAIANFRYCDRNLTARLEELGYDMISVNQGYAKCSVCVVSENALITSDKSIAQAAAAKGIDVLTIEPGHIELCERYGGFIGGSAFLADKQTLAFAGDVFICLR